MPNDINTVDKPVTVSANAGALDTATALLRYVIVILGTVPALLTLLGERDLDGFVSYLHGQDGVALVGAMSALFALGYGLVKTHRRGAEMATVAADRRVPDSVAKIS